MKYKLQRCTLSQFMEGKYEMVCPFLIYIKLYLRNDIHLGYTYCLMIMGLLSHLLVQLSSKGGPFKKIDLKKYKCYHLSVGISANGYPVSDNRT